jgi:hypothetical protein
MTLRGGKSEVLLTPISSALISPSARASKLVEISIEDMRIAKEF